MNSADLTDWLSGEAGFIAQKVLHEFMRLRVGLSWQILLKDDAFAAALERYRWLGYEAALQDLAECCQGLLRRAGTEPQRAGELVAEAAQAALARYPEAAALALELPDERRLPARLARSLLAAPRPVHEIGRTGGGRLFELLPLHTDLNRADREVVENHVRFALCGAYERLERAVDLGRLVGPAGFEPATRPL